ncbi:translation initiation factor IF-2 [Jeotgalicoccus coquinae]|uniref:Translation initiation factor IF-2 n=1 Tax=Jeotgalicoccus coquinae TaxID=709509 RepID=A0A6V7RIF5_9STAP|nr:translation initiation factor IF-2 [Jeotgalicoccus coquinae]MBB6422619.1 translation initiation factor IF-2 [Jeotgalicoccus coquinae]GGE14441.1 translation initiation factor IF-2 [Jeotgalicoccus coquinae]CAD2077787.1 Translation initiation factor IF-2 [Jeotgalicoccus coquinae]
MSKIRIHEYAKEKGLTSKEIIDFLESKKIEVKSHMSSLEDDVLKVLDAEFNKSAKKAETKPAGNKPAAKQNSKPNQQKNNNNKNKNQKNKQNQKNNAPKKQEVKKEEPKQEEPAEKHFTYEEGITVGELAEKIGVDSSVIVKDLFMLGIVTNINQSLDQDSVEVVAENYGFTSELEVFVDDTDLTNFFNLEEAVLDEERPSVVTIMGHVDHGKTTLLDSIRNTKVTAGEAGGITQHVGAYQIEHGDKKITFLDTPGHAAFTTMRARGAQVTDITILVVAADDGVMPQTIEAINHAKAAEVPIIVAVNKTDKPTANADRVMTELGEHGLYPEDWGGDTIFVPLSALTGDGIDELLEMITLVGEMAELKTTSKMAAVGTVIDAELDKSRGPAASLLVQHGTLNVGDSIVVGSTFGKVRAMVSDTGQRIKSAGPSVPVEITGINDVPEAGDRFVVFKDDKKARQIGEARHENKVMRDREVNQKVSLDNLFEQMKEGEMKDLNLIIKGDAQGSVEALAASLMKIDVEGVNVRIIHTGVGAINESDVTLANASSAIIIGFNVRPDVNAKRAAEQNKIDMRLHRIIYKVIEEIEFAMKGMLDPEYEEKVIGNVEVREIFKVSKVGTIAGAYVTDGKITRDSGVRVIRDGIVVFEGELDTLKRFKDDAKEVTTGYECGLTIKNFNDIKEGDQIEPFIMVEIERK